MLNKEMYLPIIEFIMSVLFVGGNTGSKVVHVIWEIKNYTFLLSISSFIKQSLEKTMNDLN